MHTNIHSYLKLSHNCGESRVLATLFVQQSHIAIELPDICRVHLQIRPLLHKDVSQSLVVRPVCLRSYTTC